MKKSHPWKDVPIKQGFGHFTVDRVEPGQALLRFDSVAKLKAALDRVVVEMSKYDLSTSEGKRICVRLILNHRRQEIQLIPGLFSKGGVIERRLHAVASADRNERR